MSRCFKKGTVPNGARPFPQACGFGGNGFCMGFLHDVQVFSGAEDHSGAQVSAPLFQFPLLSQTGHPELHRDFQKLEKPSFPKGC